MEFPDLGKHCSNSFCNKLDFLPMQCDACDKIFCNEHIRYDDHSCTSAYKKDVQVPVCPLCAKPIPVPRGEAPDIKVGEHIDRDCQSDPAKKKRKAYGNRCSAPKCKQHELMPVICPDCRLNFCLRHRHPQDHKCKGFQSTGRSVSNAGAAATKRYTKANSSKPKASTSRPQQTYLHNVGRDLDRERRERQQNVQRAQSNMTEDEALARALQLSVQENEIPESEMTQEQKDMKLAAKLQREEEEALRRINQPSSTSRSSDSSCRLS